MLPEGDLPPVLHTCGLHNSLMRCRRTCRKHLHMLHIGIPLNLIPSASGASAGMRLQEGLAQKYFDNHLLPILQAKDVNLLYEITREAETPGARKSKSIGEVGL